MMNFYLIVMDYRYQSNFFRKEYICALKERKATDALERFSKYIRLHYRDIEIENLGVKLLPSTYEWIKEVPYILMLSNDTFPEMPHEKRKLNMYEIGG